MLELQSLTLVDGENPDTLALCRFYRLCAYLAVPLPEEVLGHGQAILAELPYLIKEF